MAVPEERGIEDLTPRPQPVVNRALAAALVQIVVVALGLQLAPDFQYAIVDVLVYAGLPGLVAVITYVQAKLAAKKVTPVSRPVIEEGRRVLVTSPNGKLYKGRVRHVERR